MSAFVEAQALYLRKAFFLWGSKRGMREVRREVRREELVD